MKDINNYNYAGFWKRVLAALIDCIFFLPLLPITFIFNHNNSNFVITFATYVFYISYYIFFTVKYGGTPGKLLTNIKIIDKNGNNINVLKATIRLFTYILMFISALLSVILVGHIETNNPLDSLIVFLSLIDIIIVAFNSRCRAIHDYLADSFVIIDEEKINKKRNCSNKNNERLF